MGPALSLAAALVATAGPGHAGPAMADADRGREGLTIGPPVASARAASTLQATPTPAMQPASEVPSSAQGETDLGLILPMEARRPRFRPAARRLHLRPAKTRRRCATGRS